MQSVAELRALTVKQLAQMAKCRGIPGWHSMRKEELIKALSKVLRAERRKAGKTSTNLLTQHTLGIGGPNGEKQAGRRNGKSAKLKLNSSSASSPSSASDSRTESQAPPPPVDPKDLAYRFDPAHVSSDRVILIVRDPYWLQACWEITRQTVERARVALGQLWHLAKPVLRLIELDPEGTETGNRRVIGDIEIHGGVNTWYLHVPDPPRSFQVDLGYVVPGGKFHCLGRSNVVTTRPGTSAHWWPHPLSSGNMDWERILVRSAREEFAPDQDDVRDFLEEKLDRPIGEGLASRLGAMWTDAGEDPDDPVPLEIDAEVILYGTTVPGARITARGEPVEVRPDGTFVLRYPLPDRRQVFPIVAWSRDGSEQRTVLVAVERNTKAMEPIQRDTEL